jgi:hypothetical protein
VELRAANDEEARKWVAALRELQDASKEKRALNALVGPPAPPPPVKKKEAAAEAAAAPTNRGKRSGSAVVEMDTVY